MNRQDRSRKWLEAQEHKAWEQAHQAKPKFFDTFDEYVKVYSEGESWRHMVDAGHILIAAYSTCLPGEYYIASAYHGMHYKTKEPIHEVVINDGDDGWIRASCKTHEEAEVLLQEVKKLAPFHMSELLEFGFRVD